MSLVTACPACGVLFKVSPDQLLISEGWVRCGKCETVFEAGLSLQSTTLAAQELLPPVPLPLLPLAAETVRSEVHLEKTMEAEEALVAVPQTPDQAAERVIAQLPETPETPEHLGRDTFQFNQKPAPTIQVVSLTWQQRLIRATLYLLAPLLLVTLLLQVILFERNEIASREPLAKPWLLALCAPFHCRLETLKNIQSIVIDSSTFTKIRPDIYQLTLVLKNKSTADLQLPSVEVTLINSLDQALLRRVFRVDELNVQSRTLLATSELPLLFSFAIKTGELSDRVAGYRLLVFYP